MTDTIEETEQTEGQQDPATDDTTTVDAAGEEDQDQFPREYVEQLREEAKTKRIEAKDATDRADQLAQRLHTALVAATGRLQDPGDLDFDPTHLDDAEALTTAVDDLLARKPHLASRRPAGSIGQGETSGSDNVDLAAMLRTRA